MKAIRKLLGSPEDELARAVKEISAENKRIKDELGVSDKTIRNIRYNAHDSRPLTQQALDIMCLEPNRRFHITDIASELNIDYKTTSNVLAQLARQGHVRGRRGDGKYWMQLSRHLETYIKQLIKEKRRLQKVINNG